MIFILGFLLGVAVTFAALALIGSIEWETWYEVEDEPLDDVPSSKAN
jgi:hypothetical protein